jgi:tetratricopeptide (TPR) repeat protein
MRRKLNRKLLVRLLAALAVLVTAGHFLHGNQVQRHADLWLRQASMARERGDMGSCLEYLSRYLTLQPTDTDALLDYGLTLEQLGPSFRTRWQALGVLEQVQVRRPNSPEVRRHLVRLTMGLGLPAEARSHLNELLATSPEDGELEHRVGQCLEGMGDYTEAVTWYEKATQHAPGQIASYERLADMLEHRLQEAPRAAEVLDRMVAANPQSFEAYLIRARFSRALRSPEQLAPDIDRARQLAPDNPEVLQAVAELAALQNKPEEARGFLRQGLGAHPRHVGLYLALAELDVQGQRVDEAVACLRRGLSILPEQTELLHALADLLLQQGQQAPAGAVITRLARGGSPLAQAGYWEARLRMQDQQWTEAARLLEEARARLAVTPEWLKPIELALGQCHEQLGDRDRALAAFRRAVALDPSSVPARYGLGVALLEAGRVSEAVGELWRLVRLPGAPPDAWIALARAFVRRNRQLAPDRRDWPEVDRALEQAARRAGESVPVLLVRAEALAARDQPEQARQLLEQARDRQPDQVALWIALARLAENPGALAAAGRILDEARQRLGDRIELRQERLRLLERTGGVRLRQGLAELEKGLEKFPILDQCCLLEDLAEVHYRHGNLAEAERIARYVAEQQPHDLRCRALLVNLALQSGQEADLERTLADIRQIEGEEGAQWRVGEAERWILQARRGNRRALVRARAYLADAARRRPDWARVPLVEAAVDELEGNQERAIQDYQRAQELGDRQPAVAQRLAQLLYERRRFGEADRALRALYNTVPLRGAFGKLAAEIALANQELGRAVDIARQVVAPSSRDYREQLWLAHILEAAGRLSEAETMLRTTVQQAGTIPETWLALVRFLVARQQRARAAAVVEQMQHLLPPEKVALTRARCYEAMGRLEQAGAQYQAALAESPDDALVLEKAAAFYLQIHAQDKAEPLLRRLLASALATEEQVAWARRQLAVDLAGKGTDAAYHEALVLVKPNGNERSTDDRRVRARVLATRPERQREALTLIEGTLAAQPLTAEDQRFLAELYEAVGDRTKAREQWLNLLGATGQRPKYVAAYVQVLLRWEEVGEAQRWFARWEQIEPQSPRSAALKEALRQARAGDRQAGR